MRISSVAGKSLFSQKYLHDLNGSNFENIVRLFPKYVEKINQAEVLKETVYIDIYRLLLYALQSALTC